MKGGEESVTCSTQAEDMKTQKAFFFGETEEKNRPKELYTEIKQEIIFDTLHGKNWVSLRSSEGHLERHSFSPN
jgi:hypothetical protein